MNKLNWKKRNLCKRVEEAKDKLKLAQAKLDAYPHNKEVKKDEVDCLQVYNEAVSDEEKFLFQKSKIEWMSCGDRNGKYFHKMVKSRQHSSRIMCICDERGNKYEGKVMAEQFINHFKEFLSARRGTVPLEDFEGLFGTRLNEKEAADMICAISDKEIKEAMFDIGENKAPGSDGYSFVFFKKAWPVVGEDVCKAVKEFFTSGKLLGEMNATLLTLVPKQKQPIKVSDYRPITCCNVVYKRISKIITNRLKNSLQKIVNLNQSAFIEGRLIQDNILITQKLLKGYDRKSEPKRCCLKINIAKAYDTVDWCFLEKSLHGYFTSGRGLRKGDPMSPYLFTHVMEVFTLLMMKNTQNEPHFRYHKGCKELKITHLCFVDDLLVLCHGDANSVRTIKKTLEEFSNISGLIPNINKSTIFFGNVDSEEKQRIIAELPFNVGKLHVKYLGVPLVTKKLGAKECKQFVDKIKNKVED
ncbi:RNA-directed DNA polymerase, eukaryota, reverse transcriptase zinc-binding domain protein [Tanacetum coccineum]